MRDTVAAVAAMTSLLSGPALAGSGGLGIECRGAFQRVAGGWVATPYCEDANLAWVARSHGMKVDAADIRRDYASKRRACRLAGGNIRVIEACSGTWTRTSRP